MRERINITDNISNDIYISYTKNKTKREKPFFLLRYIIVIGIFAALMGMSMWNNKFTQKTVATIKFAILYDMDIAENKVCGEIPAFEELKKRQEEE